jgi:putative membrane protein
MSRANVIAAVSSGLLAATLPVVASAQSGYGHYGDHMWSGGGWHGWFLGPLMMIFWLLVLVGGVILILRWLGVSGPAGPGRGKAGSDALDILRERFARGEIDKAEFEERRALLER